MDEEDIQEMTASLAAAKEFSVDLYGGLSRSIKLFSARLQKCWSKTFACLLHQKDAASAS